MMLYYDQFVDAPKTGRGRVSDTIYTFDIEVTSLFHFPDGWDVFRPELPPEAYADIERVGIPYIWMFGVEADGKCNVYYGREFRDCEKIFKQIADPNYKKFVYIHNAGYEFQFLIDIFQKYTITNMCARTPRKPIRWIVKEWNIEFRCSYMLTNMSLERAAERYTDLRKLSGSLNYNVKRSPRTILTQEENSYCEYDIRTLQAIIEHFREEYGHLKVIPLTQTGEVRKELRKRVSMDYIYKIRKQTASNAHIQQLMMRAFMGGITHGSYLHAGRILYDMISYDETSAYPAMMLSEKYPAYKWVECTPKFANGANREDWAILYHVRLHNLESKYINTYILVSKAVNSHHLLYDKDVDITLDNGRLLSLQGDYIEMVLTEVDFDIIRECYDIGKIEYLECYRNIKEYLEPDMINYILDLYEQKTTLKGVTSEDGMAEALYMKSKQRINSVFGMCVTSVFKGEVVFEGEEWSTLGITDERIKEKLQELRKSRTNCCAYQHGIYITAYNRKRLFDIVMRLDASVVGMDKAAVYFDTDSIKTKDSEELREAVEHSNKVLWDKLLDMCKARNIAPERLSPKDIKGVKHPIGLWEFDGHYKEFKFLGAKRYAYRGDDDQLHITVSGVNSKLGAAALDNDLNNFKRNKVFNYDQTGKLTSFYNDEQPKVRFKDVDGHWYTSHQKHGICLQSVEYSMSIDDLYEALWELERIHENRR